MLPIRKFFLIWFSVVMLSSFACATASADGGYPSPKNAPKVYIPEQRAIVYFKDGREDLIIRSSYERTERDDFGWIIPLPSIPEIDSESEGLLGIFSELLHLTTDELPSHSPKGGGSSGGGGAGGNGGGVIVIQEEVVGIYEVTILEANTFEDLAEWLSDNNFAVPEGSGPVFQDYIDRDWFFVCMRLDSSTNYYGYVHPLRLSFPTDSPVFPMQLTEFNSDVTELLMYVLTEGEYTFSGASDEWCYYVLKVTLSKYRLLDALIDGDVFITKLRASYSTEIQTFPTLTRYDDITLKEAEARTQVEVWPYKGKASKGYRHTFRAIGGTPLYTWSSSDETVCEIDAETGEFTGIEFGYCSVTAEDAAGNKGSSGTITVGKDGDGGCFIATAAYGSPMEPHVKVLCDFRDRFLLTNSVGRVLVNFYNNCSPPISEFIANHDIARLVVRWSLLPFVGVSWMSLRLGPVATLGIMLLLFGLVCANLAIVFRGMRRRLDLKDRVRIRE
jgi:hypothetical protein